MTTLSPLVQGDTWEIQVAKYNPLPNGKPDVNSPVDFTGYEAKLQLKTAAYATVLTLTSNPAAGLVVNDNTSGSDGPLGTIDVHATPAQTELFEPGSLLWEIEVTKTVSSVIVDRRTLAGGILPVVKQITS